jgi:hypothetical protein
MATNEAKAAQLTSMKLPLRKPTSEEKMYPTMAKDADGDEYPYGLRITLDDEQLKQLGIAKLPSVDDTTAIQATGHICSSHESKDANGARRSVTIQLTHLSVE